MGWDFYTYENQPPFFLEELRIFMFQENELVNDNERKAQSSIKKGNGYPRYG